MRLLTNPPTPESDKNHSLFWSLPLITYFFGSISWQTTHHIVYWLLGVLIGAKCWLTLALVPILLEQPFKVKKNSLWLSPVATDIEPRSLTAVHHSVSIDTELVIYHLHLLGGLDGDGAWGYAMEVVVIDHQLVCMHNLKSWRS